MRLIIPAFITILAGVAIAVGIGQQAEPPRNLYTIGAGIGLYILAVKIEQATRKR